LENSDAEVDINSAWEAIRENMETLEKESLGCYELKTHKTRFKEGCSKLLDQKENNQTAVVTRSKQNKWG
jgi:hypothetical protein